MFARQLMLVIAQAIIALLISINTVFAEGWFQVGDFQRLREYVNGRSNALFVDVLAPGEWINISACGENNDNPLSVEVRDPSGVLVVPAQTLTAGAGLVDCTDPLTTPIANPLRIQAPSVGQYEIRLSNNAGTWFERYDVTITSTDAVDPDPTGATGIIGRLSAVKWEYSSGGFEEDLAADTNYFVLTPGGFPSTNYVWLLDLNNFSGFVYDISANGIGVDPPRAGFSTPTAGNATQPEFSLYLAYPEIAGPQPSGPPAISGFGFTDDAGEDLKFSPGTTIGVQDSGTFQFTTNTDSATYAITIDIDQDGVFGNPGDVFLVGRSVNGLNSVVWDGTDVNGNVVSDGNYSATLSIRLGEFHFVARDAETSGGSTASNDPANAYGLTVFEATRGGGLIPTRVFWDDETVLGGSLTAFEPNPRTVPFGAFSGTPNSYHTWGDFTGSSFGDETLIDTFVYGREASVTAAAIVADDDTTASGSFTGIALIDAMTVGEPVDLLVGDQDLIGTGTLTATVNNPRTGEIETVTLTESLAQPGNFTGTLATAAGASSDDAPSNGSINILAGDDLTLTYADAANASGSPQPITDSDTVGGTDGVPSILVSTAGEPIQLNVDDIDLAGSGTLIVEVINQNTGETETVTLSETGGFTGIFSGLLPSVAATGPDGTTGQMNVVSLDLIRIDYLDGLRSDGSSITVSDLDTVKEGSAAFVFVEAETVGSDVTVTLVDGDRSNTGLQTVTFTNQNASETETIVLTEVPGNPGTFVSQIATVFGTTAGTNLSDGIFNAQDRDTFLVSYDDIARPAGSPAIVTDTDVISGGVTGTPDIQAVSVGSPLLLEVNDSDLAASGNLTVTIANNTTGEIETVTLLETGASTGVFQASLPTAFGTASDGDGANNSINAAAGDSFTITYSDALRDDGSPGVATDAAIIAGGINGTAAITATRVGEPLDVEVADSDLAGTGTLTVTVTNGTTSEIETVVLTETGSLTGVFQAVLPTAFGTSNDGSGSNGSIHAAANDTFTITYEDGLRIDGSTGQATDTATISGGIDGAPSIAATTVGNPLQIEVTDNDLSGTGNLTATVTNTTTGELETVTLSETSASTGIFQFALPTTFGLASDGDGANGSINSANGDIFTITYSDALRSDGSASDVSASDTIAGGGQDGTVTIEAGIPGAAITLEVEDADLIGAGTLDVSVTNIATSETETVTLTETGAATGIFQAGLASEFSQSPDTDNDGNMAGEAGNTLRIDYIDALRESGQPDLVISSTDPFIGGATGIPEISATLVGNDLILRVRDADGIGTATLSVTVTNNRTGEIETVSLSETGASTGIFEASLATTFGAASDGSNSNGSINTVAGDQLSISYSDALRDNGSAGTETAITNISGGSTGTPSISIANVGDPALLTVNDPDIAGFGSITVSVTNETSGEAEQVSLSETSPGIFQDSLPTSAAAGSDGSTTNGSINVLAGDVLRIDYSDAFRKDGSTGVESANDTPAGGTNGAPGITATQVGQPVALSLIDADLAGTSTVVVLVTNLETGETETVSLAENTASLGTFQGTLASTFSTGAGTNEDGVIHAESGDRIQIDYQDAFTSDGTSGSASMVSTIGGGTTGLVSITATVVGQPVTIQLNDSDLSGTGTVIVLVLNPSTGETETVSLSETNPSSGLFLGSLATVFGTVSDGSATNGSISAADGDVLQVTYNDVLRDNGSSGNETSSDTIDGGTNGTISLSGGMVGEPLNIVVVDADLIGTGALTVTVRNPATGEIETATLTESTTTPGTFSANLATAFGTTTDGNGNNGSIHVEAGVALEATYLDTLRDTGASEAVITTYSPTGGVAALVTVAPTTVGQPISVSITDPDRAGDALITAALANTDTGEVELVTLTEDPDSPGTFTTSVPSQFSDTTGTDNDGTLSADAGDTIELSYVDPLLIDGSQGSVSANNPILGGTNATVSVNPSIPGAPIDIEITDADLAGAGSITATVINQTTGEQETIALSEDPVNPGVFMTTVPTVFATTGGKNDDGTLNIQASDTISLSFADPLGTNGGPFVATSSGTVSGGTTSVVSATSVSVGTPITIRITDPDLAGQSEITLVATNPATGDSETVTLNEDPAMPGQFIGQIPTLLEPFNAGSENGTLSVSPGDTISFTFPDALADNGGPRTVSTSIVIDNRAPVANVDSAATGPNSAVAIPVLLNDLDADGTVLSVASFDQPTVGGTVIATPDGNLVFTPTLDFVGVATFNYTASDPQGLNDTSTVTVTVNGLQPTAVSDSASAAPGTAVVIPVLSNDLGPGENALTIQSVNQPANGTVTQLSDGAIRYTPNARFIGQDSFIYTIVNLDGLTDSAIVNLTVDGSTPNVVTDNVSTVFDTSVVVSALENDIDPSGLQLEIASVTQPANGTVTLNPDQTLAYVPTNGFYGSDSFSYTACNPTGGCASATVLVQVEPPLANVTGIVFEDLDHDRTRDANELRQAGWTVELVQDGIVLAMDVTGADGTYRFMGVRPRNDYQIRFRHPQTNMVWSRLDNVVLLPGATVFDQNLPIDPSGVVYDLATREPVENMRLSLVDGSGTPLPTVCLLDPSQQNQITGPDGFYRFDLAPQNGSAICPPAQTQYRIEVSDASGISLSAPPGFEPETQALDPTGGPSPFLVVPQNGAPQIGDPTTYYLSFLLETGDPNVVNNHIPVVVTPLIDLLANKRAGRRVISRGELLPYTITISNAASNDRAGISVVDVLPHGIVYRAGSGTVNGIAVEPTVSGNTLTWSDLTVPANAQLTVTLIAAGSSALSIGEHTNRAFVFDPFTNRQISNIATATVDFEADPDFDCPTILGRVFEDVNGNGTLEEGERGLKGVRLATVKGTLIKTGTHGRYHLPCPNLPNAQIGSNFVLKLDELTLPRGFQLISRNPQIVRLTRGKVTKVNFAARRLAEITLDFSNDAFLRNSAQLKPRYERRIGKLIEILEETPAALALVYHRQPAEGSVGRERLTRIHGLIRERWRQRGDPYDLSIQRSVEVQK